MLPDLLNVTDVSRFTHAAVIAWFDDCCLVIANRTSTDLERTKHVAMHPCSAHDVISPERVPQHLRKFVLHSFVALLPAPLPRELLEAALIAHALAVVF